MDRWGGSAEKKTQRVEREEVAINSSFSQSKERKQMGLKWKKQEFKVVSGLQLDLSLMSSVFCGMWRQNVASQLVQSSSALV